jgi:uncharacterized protein YyaL (SSP411 family)
MMLYIKQLIKKINYNKTTQICITMHKNNLINEKSPYLLQHAHNPVNWYPWGKEAIGKAVSEDKPIFLSIGYSTCHWCHVMEKESFEDNEVADLMNRAFVSIKVDREERPDIDGIYMTVCQMLTGSGGWPLTIILTPDQKPFFAGTYFPKNDRFGKSGLLTLIPQLMDLWNNKRQEVITSSVEIADSLKLSLRTTPGNLLSTDIFQKAFKEFKSRYDSEFGGFGSSPKFPTPHNLIFLLRYWKRYNDSAALEMVENTLTKMRLGGIYDQIGFGFHRYSTDRQWLVPHFEKMLYDQALLVPIYLEAYQATDKKLFLDTAEEILSYVMREMTSPNGGFYSAEDADSDGKEGKFYLWTKDEIANLVPDEKNFALSIFNVNKDGNWIDSVNPDNKGTNILHLSKTFDALAADLKSPPDILMKDVTLIRGLLFEERERRIHPFKDNKILTDWNSLMITAFSKAAQVTGSEIYISYAKTAADFISGYLTDKTGRLLHRYREGESSIPANLDDYAFFIQALLDLYETNFSLDYLGDAKYLLDQAIHDFWDDESGGFFFSRKNSNDLIANQKETYDGAIPSGNSVMVLNLLRLSKITAKTEYEEKAESINRAFSENISKSPSAFSQALTGFDFGFGPSFEIVISSNEYDYYAGLMVKELRKYYLPNKIVLLKTTSNNLENIAPYVSEQNSINGKAAVYVCKNFTCTNPLTDHTKLAESLI